MAVTYCYELCLSVNHMQYSLPDTWSQTQLEGSYSGTICMRSITTATATSNRTRHERCLIYEIVLPIPLSLLFPPLSSHRASITRTHDTTPARACNSTCSSRTETPRSVSISKSIPRSIYPFAVGFKAVFSLNHMFQHLHSCRAAEKHVLIHHN